GENPTGKSPAAEVGRLAPNFELAGLDGSVQRLSDYRGRYVLLNFWASWCGPCKIETPDLQRFSDEVDTSKLVVVGLNQQERPSVAQDFVEQFDVTYPIVLDRSGEVSLAYRVGRSIPVTMLIDPDGVI